MIVFEFTRLQILDFSKCFDPGLDIYSNGLAIRFDGDPVNPKICVKYVSITGDCINNNNCDDIKSYQTGYCINEICSITGIYENCGLKSSSCDCQIQMNSGL